MATHVSHAPVSSPPRLHEATWSPALVPIGRVLFALIFVVSSLHHFSAASAAYAASQGVPWPTLLVPFSGVIALVGSLMVAVGFHTRLGALLLIVFLVPVTMMMHRFWLVADPMMRSVQQAMFLKNLSMLGTAVLFLYWGGGPFSVDERRR